MRILAACMLAVGVLCATTAQTPTPSPIDVAKNYLDTMLRTGHADPAWFSASFLAQIPASRVDEVIANRVASLGAYQSVEYTPNGFVAHFAKGTDDIAIGIDADNKITVLFFKPPVVATSSLDDALRALQAMPGTVSYVITEGGHAERAAFNVSAQLAVGSAFKLAALSALRDEIASGTRHWTDVVPLRAQWKSLPSGVLRTWPDGTPLTLATYAAEMVSISDNTAADAMVRLVGAAALEKYAGSNQPFITTREAFILKSNEGATLRKAYSAASTVAGRATVLAQVDKLPLPAIDALLTTPDLGVEWHYSVRELCALMAGVADLPVMSINPGVAGSGTFAHVAYKGGSDFGVLNMTTMVTTKRGTKLCFSATVNNAERDVDESAFESAYGAALVHLATL